MMKLTAWYPKKTDEIDGSVTLKAAAQYPRGEIPTRDDLSEINFRVKTKFRTAEMTDMKRTFVPSKDGEKEPSRVWWTVTWRTFARGQA